MLQRGVMYGSAALLFCHSGSVSLSLALCSVLAVCVCVLVGDTELCCVCVSDARVALC